MQKSRRQRHNLIPGCINTITDFLFTAFCLLSEAKEDEDTKRQELLDFYKTTKEFVSGMDKEDLDLLQAHVGNIEKNFKRRMTQLEHKECFLFVTGKYSLSLPCNLYTDPFYAPTDTLVRVM